MPFLRNAWHAIGWESEVARDALFHRRMSKVIISCVVTGSAQAREMLGLKGGDRVEF